MKGVGVRGADEGGNGPGSGRRAFARSGAPSVAFFTGFHQDHHRATDTAQRLHLTGLPTIVDVAEERWARRGRPPRRIRTRTWPVP